ncbi:hypothetical protein A2U01_0066556 [Trifolium medium]|uniref:Uncharacterized protein n=1 Tax=Trifolium medium TaxID=97028 RepID=A0A392SA78_9FABA|nr:hypothetical protein [Trifolium medium]
MEFRCYGFTFLEIFIIFKWNNSFSLEGSKKMIGNIAARVCTSEANKHVVRIFHSQWDDDDAAAGTFVLDDAVIGSYSNCKS